MSEITFGRNRLERKIVGHPQYRRPLRRIRRNNTTRKIGLGKGIISRCEEDCECNYCNEKRENKCVCSFFQDHVMCDYCEAKWNNPSDTDSDNECTCHKSPVICKFCDENYNVKNASYLKNGPKKKIKLDPINDIIEEIPGLFEDPNIKKQECIICFDYKQITYFKFLPCFHSFCSCCLDQMLRKECPLCRTPF